MSYAYIIMFDLLLIFKLQFGLGFNSCFIKRKPVGINIFPKKKPMPDYT